MSSIYRHVGRRLQKALLREPKRGLIEWMEHSIYFTTEEQSPITGAFKAKYSPHFYQLAKYVDDPRVVELWCKWASQSGKSLFGIAACAKKLDTEPATVIYAQPNKDDIPKILDVKIDPVLKSMRSLWNKFKDFKESEKIRSKGAIKRVAGGSLVISGSSVKERKSLTSPFIVADEIGEFEKGSISELRERSKTFSSFFPFFLGISTIVSPEDEVCTGYDSCVTKIEYQMYCQECDTHFFPSFETVKYLTPEEYQELNSISDDDFDFAKYQNSIGGSEHIECPNCRHKIYEDERKKLILSKKCDWVLVGGEWGGKSIGASMNSVCSFFAPLYTIVEAVVKAGDDPIKLDKVKRGWFNEFHSEEAEIATEAHAFTKLCINEDELIVPDDTVYVYMGVDTQKDHFWAFIVAYREGKNPHVIHASRPDTFREVYELFKKPLYYNDGIEFLGGIRRMGIDMQGYVETEMQFNEVKQKEEKVILTNRPQEVQEFVYEFGELEGQIEDRERIYATRGHETLTNDAPYILSDTRVEIGERREKRRMKFAKMNTISLKLTVLSYINRAIRLSEGKEVNRKDKNIVSFSKNFCSSYGGTNDKLHVFEQLSSEEYGWFKNKKHKTFRRVKKDNHYFDCFVICEMLAQMDRVEQYKAQEKTEQITMDDLFN